jgi:hypothetical protein
MVIGLDAALCRMNFGMASAYLQYSPVFEQIFMISDWLVRVSTGKSILASAAR